MWEFANIRENRSTELFRNVTTEEVTSSVTENVTNVKRDDVDWMKGRDSLGNRHHEISLQENPVYEEPSAAWNNVKEALNEVNRECIPMKALRNTTNLSGRIS